MEQKVALVTGGTGGLGTTIVDGLLAEGYLVAIHTLNQFDKKSNLETTNKNCKVYQADLRIEAEIEELIQAIIKDFGKLNIVINAAGISHSAISWKQTLEDWNTVMSTNVTAPFLISKYAIPHLRKEKHSRLIYISSVVAQKPLPGTSAYSSSKAALEGFTKAQAIELSRYDITVNCIAPGYFEVGMINTVEESLQQKIISETPLNRLGKPEELFECIKYLCSENSGFMTGQILQLNGGLYL